MTFKGVLIVLAAIGLAALAWYWLRLLPTQKSRDRRPGDGDR